VISSGKGYAGAIAEPDPHFLDGANPVLGTAIVLRDEPELPIVVLVVEDSEDDELVSVMAEATDCPATGYGGAWAAQVKPDGLTIKFLLIRLGGGWERAWTFPNPPEQMLDAIGGGPHHVAILPRELAGDLDKLAPASLGGSVIIEAQASESVRAAREAHDRLTK
jgi:hypothetical protein